MAKHTIARLALILIVAMLVVGIFRAAAGVSAPADPPPSKRARGRCSSRCGSADRGSACGKQR